MEIVFVSTPTQSNFDYCSKLFKNKKPLNGFNKLIENVDIVNRVDDNEFWSKNLFFDEEINGILYLNYPFSVVLKDNVKFKSLHELISEIRRVYKEAYLLEEKTSQNKAIPMYNEDSNCKLINRNRTNGIIGI